MIARVWLPILLVLCIARLWVTPLASSFWVDEAETAFVAEHGYDHPSLAVVPQITASVYYWLPHAIYRISGFSEIAERLPSLAAMALALLLIACLAARLIHPQAAWFAVFACLALRAFNYEAANARPYALGICVAALSLWLLVRWLDSGRWLDGVLFLASAALLWRVQLIYWPFYLVYAVYFFTRSDRCVSWVQAATIFAGLVVALIAVIPAALAVKREAALHAFAPQPSVFDLGCVQVSSGRGRDRRLDTRTVAPVAASGITAILAGDLPDRRMVGRAACGPVRVFALHRHQCLLDALFVHRASRRGAGRYRWRGLLRSTVALAFVRPGDGNRRATFLRPMGGAVAAASQFRLARGGAGRQRPGARAGCPCAGGQPVYRRQAA